PRLPPSFPTRRSSVLIGADDVAPDVAPQEEATASPEPTSPLVDMSTNAQEVSSVKPSVLETRLNPKYTFETFVIGSSNRFPHAAAVAVAESPGRAYNPLLVYGDS